MRESREICKSAHEGNVEASETFGLEPIYALVSSDSDWDKYEGLHWYAMREYVNSHPEDPDLKDLLSRGSKDRESYLKYERSLFGWAVYLSQKTS